MKQIVILVCCLALTACAKVGTASNENTPTNSNKTVASPTPENNVPLKTVVPNVKFSAKEQKYLNESLPPKVREILEKAEKFEILAEVKGDDNRLDEGMNFEPNRIARITDENDKKAILEAFYFDVASDAPPSACYLPHHSIRAVYQGKNVEIEICFECSRFFVKSDFGEFEGTVVREIGRSEKIIKQIVESKSIELNQSK